LEAVKQLVADNKGEIAAIIIEPVAGNMGCILPQPGFLEGLRKICDEEAIVFIFDEVMTGFRLGAGGAQQQLNIAADLVTYGKVIGGGMPVGAFGGKKAIMQLAQLPQTQIAQHLKLKSPRKPYSKKYGILWGKWEMPAKRVA
jgi:glutamate-1-semialdehyde 2,1-aminomutase